MDRLFQRLVAFTHDAVYRYRFDDGVILMANHGLVEVLDLDCTAEQLVGRQLRDVLVYIEKEGSLRHAIEANGEVHGFEYHFRTLKGDDRWVLHDSFMVNDPATGDRIVEAIAKDITDRKRAELELQRLNDELEERVRRRTLELATVNKDLEAFAYSVSHDLRAPLRHIEAFSKLILDLYSERFDDRGRDYLERIRRNVARMEALIEDILQLSRVSRTVMQIADVDLGALAAEIAADLQQTAPTRTAEFILAPKAMVKGDAALLRTALQNLLGNAWKFTSGRTATRIEFGVTAIEGERVFYVKDNGVGFDMTYAGRLFVPFQRLHDTAAFPGTGIGLFSVQRIIARHGGRVWAQGEVDRGATIFFTLDDTRAPAAVPPPAPP